MYGTVDIIASGMLLSPRMSRPKLSRETSKNTQGHSVDS